MYICSTYKAMSEETQEIVDNMELTAGITYTWKEMRFVVNFVNCINSLVHIYAHEPNSALYKLLTHTLTKINIHMNLLVIILVSFSVHSTVFVI
jgi:hypothetical protein